MIDINCTLEGRGPERRLMIGEHCKMVDDDEDDGEEETIMYVLTFNDLMLCLLVLCGTLIIFFLLFPLILFVDFLCTVLNARTFHFIQFT